MNFKMLKVYLQANWIKTIYLNFRILPFLQALHLPILLFGKTNLRIGKYAKVVFSAGGGGNSRLLWLETHIQGCLEIT